MIVVGQLDADFGMDSLSVSGQPLFTELSRDFGTVYFLLSSGGRQRLGSWSNLVCRWRSSLMEDSFYCE
jgi:hypothetical protein